MSNQQQLYTTIEKAIFDFGRKARAVIFVSSTQPFCFLM
jgi:hypothetical protein